MLKSILVLIFSVIIPVTVTALKHDLHIKHDDRNLFKIETFGFLEGGITDITLTDFSIEGLAPSNSSYQIGLLLRRTDSESEAQQDLEKAVENNECILDPSWRDKEDLFIDLSSPDTWKSTSYVHTIANGAAGLYSLEFARCVPTGARHIQFRLQVTFSNPGPNYLSAGDAPLPSLYFIFFVAFLVATIVWILVVVQAPQYQSKVHSIHHMMTVLAVLKTITTLLESIKFHYLSLTGTSDVWAVIYYIFAACKGIMLFIVILLIGTSHTHNDDTIHQTPFIPDPKSWLYPTLKLGSFIIVVLRRFLTEFVRM